MINYKRAVLSAVLFLFDATLPLMAQDVTLRSPDSQVEINGTLLGFDGEFYRLQTKYGELTVDGSGVSCTGPGCPNLQHFVAEVAFSGSSTMGAVLMPALLEAFAMRQGYSLKREGDDIHFAYLLHQDRDNKLVARFDFRATNTDEGFADLLADEADIVMALREIRSDERMLAQDAGLGDMTGQNRSRVLALDAVVPVVASGNPITRLSPTNLAQVFSGQITNWQELGGPDAPIDLHMPEEGSGLSQAIIDQLMEPAGLSLASNIKRHVSLVRLSDAVDKDIFSIGLTSFSESGGTKILTLGGECGFSLDASRRTIKTEDYPLTAPMFLYFPARRLPKVARQFLAFTREPAAQIVMRRAEFIDQIPEEVPVEQQGNRFTNAITIAGAEIDLATLQDMTKTLKPMARLTTSFRFQPGSTRLDAQSRSNVQQLARALEQGKYDARRLLFVGFSDGQGAAKDNQKIALRRAQTVLRAVSAAAITANLDRVDLGAKAFGEAMPMACDETSWGRRVNRRVEVWVQ